MLAFFVSVFLHRHCFFWRVQWTRNQMGQLQAQCILPQSIGVGAASNPNFLDNQNQAQVLYPKEASWTKATLPELLQQQEWQCCCLPACWSADPSARKNNAKCKQFTLHTTLCTHSQCLSVSQLMCPWPIIGHWLIESLIKLDVLKTRSPPSVWYGNMLLFCRSPACGKFISKSLPSNQLATNNDTLGTQLLLILSSHKTESNHNPWLGLGPVSQ